MMRTYKLEEHHIRLLILAGDAWDRCEDAREDIAKNGTTYVNRSGEPRPHPSIMIERDARIAFARLIRELGLDINEADSRPPELY